MARAWAARHPVFWRGIAVFLVAEVLFSGTEIWGEQAGWWDEPRLYPRHSWVDVRRGGGNLERALAHYKVQLPCQDGLRWYESASFRDSAGTLYFKFTPSESCLAGLIANLGGDPAAEQRATGASGSVDLHSATPYPLPNMDWQFPPEHVYGWYKLPVRHESYQARPRRTLVKLLVDRTVGTVYVEVDWK